MRHTMEVAEFRTRIGQISTQEIVSCPFYLTEGDRAMMDVVEPKTVLSDLEAIWEAALGRRFRKLSPYRQQAVIRSIGCDEAFSCPLVEAYGVSRVLGTWDVEECDAMGSYGVDFAIYKAFLRWNDTASRCEIAQCQAWLRAQMEGTHA